MRYYRVRITKSKSLKKIWIFRTSRPWRSNSLTPPSGNLAMNSSNPGSSSSSNPHHEWIQFQAKGRSHSLTYVRDTINSNSEVSHSILCPTTSAGTAASTFDEKEIEEMIRNLQEGSGMRGKFYSFAFPLQNYIFDITQLDIQKPY